MDFYRVPILRDKKNRELIGMAVAVIWAVVLVWFGFVSGIRGALDAQETIVQAQGVEKQLDAKIAAINQAKELRADAVKNAEMVSNGMPQSPKVITFVNSISLLTSNSNLILNSLDYQGAASSLVPTDLMGGVETLNFSVGVRGQFQSIREFTDKLEKLPRVIKITGIKVEEQRIVRDTSIVVEQNEQGEDVVIDESLGDPIEATVQGEFYYMR